MQQMLKICKKETNIISFVSKVSSIVNPIFDPIATK
jgi:hypothetical protein